MKRSLLALTLIIYSFNLMATTRWQLIEKKIMMDPNFEGSICYLDKLGSTHHIVKGFREVKNLSPLKGSTPMLLASNSKMFVGAAILKLEEQKKLKTSDPIVKYFPELKEKGYPKEWKDVKVYHLALHTSGLPDVYETPYFKENGFKIHMGFTELIKALKNQKFAHHPGEKFYYANTGYIFLGEIIKRVSKYQSLAKYFKEEFFKPLHMNSAVVGLTEKNTTYVSHSYVYKGEHERLDYLSLNKIKDPHLNDPFVDGNIYMTPCDQLKWAQALIYKKLLSKKQYAKYLGKKKFGYSYGLSIFKKEGDEYATHDGAWLGHHHSFIVNLSNKTGLAFASNALTEKGFKKFKKFLVNGIVLKPDPKK